MGRKGCKQKSLMGLVLSEAQDLVRGPRKKEIIIFFSYCFQLA